MGDGDETIETLQKEAELLKAKLLIERSKVSDKNRESMSIVMSIKSCQYYILIESLSSHNLLPLLL